MGYKVIHYFEDLQDFNHPYKVGDVFPRLGMKVSEKRILELSTNKNRQGKPLIEKESNEDLVVDMDIPKAPEDNLIENYTKTDINRMPIFELRVLARDKGISGYESMKGLELKKQLIKLFGL